jgi:hypothetical protein
MIEIKKCGFCLEPVIDKRKNAKFCRVSCRIKAFRLRNGIREPFEKTEAKTGLKIDISNSKGFTCCENGKFYSPAFNEGKLLICDECKAQWVRKK